MNNLQKHLLLSGPVPLDDFVEATNRVVARLGSDVRMTDETMDEIERELHDMALCEPEGELFV